MKWVLIIVGALALIVVLVIAVGYSLPKAHTASVRAHYRQTPDSLYRAIVDVQNGPTWRTGLDSVRVIEQQPLKWQESADWGQLTMIMDENTAPTRVVSRIADTSQGFGGTWTYQITPAANGSVVSITEQGEVFNPVFRFMSKFVFGHYRSLETYARDLGRRFNETVEPERVDAD
jgi:hypothetical protein